MTADPILTLAWLTLAHLVADFVLQTAEMVADKSSHGSRAWRGLLAHGIGVAVCLVPVVLAFGVPGLWVLVVVTASHVAIDRGKVLLTRSAEARALADAHRRHEGRAPAAGLGRAWTPIPATFFLLDQVAHLAVLALAWAIWLAGAVPTATWASGVGGLLGGRDLAAIHDVVLAGVVIAGLLIANIRAGALFVAILVRPFEAAKESGLTEEGPADPRRPYEAAAAPVAAPPTAAPPAPAAAPSPGPAPAPPERNHVPTPARVGATIGVLERLLIVTFLLAGADAAIGFVLAAKTIARFRQLDDRDFAEYYLLGTLASVAVAIATGMLARAALA